jgi:hypothetical protein
MMGGKTFSSMGSLFFLAILYLSPFEFATFRAFSLKEDFFSIRGWGRKILSMRSFIGTPFRWLIKRYIGLFFKKIVIGRNSKYILYAFHDIGIPQNEPLA